MLNIDEEWLLDAMACSAGLVNPSPLDTLLHLEDMSSDEATMYINDLFNYSKGNTMKTNFIHALVPSTAHTLEVRLNNRLLINAMTGQMVSSLMSHCSRRPDLDASLRALAAKFRKDTDEDHIDSLDARNQADEFARGQEIKDQLTDEAGHEVEIPPLRIADILNGLRYTLYDDLASQLGPETPVADDVLMTKNPHLVGSYDLPMALELFYEFRVSKADQVDPRTVKEAVEDGEDEEFARAALQEAADKNKKRLIDMKHDIMIEAQSLVERYDTDAFMALPVPIQQHIAAKVLNKLKDENKRLFVIGTRVATVKRNGEDVPIATLRRFVKQGIKVCEAFIEECMLVTPATAAA